MKLLILGNRFPWPTHDGGAIATYQMLKAMAFEGVDITYFSFNTQKHFCDRKTLTERFSFLKYVSVPLDASVRMWPALLNLLSVKSYHLQRYHSEKANQALAELLQSESFDLVHIEGLYSAPFLPTVRAYFTGKVSYRAHNVEWEIWSRLAQATSQPFKKWYLNIQAKRLQKAEEAFIQKVDLLVPISPVDEMAFSKLASKPTLLYSPGILMGLDERLELQPNKLFHLGSMEWPANVQGVQWFLTQVWPLVLADFPEAEFHIAGKGLNPNDPRIFQSNVYNHGEVENARNFMRTHGICVVPILAGSGIRMKLIESMSYGIPCVTTQVGVQGLSPEAQKSLVIASEPRVMATAIVDLLKNYKKAVDMGQQGQKAIEFSHNLQKNTKELLAFYAKQIGERQK